MRDNNDKNIYEMLNDIEVDLSEFDIEEFNDIEKIKIKKKFRSSIGQKDTIKKRKKYASIASVALISFGIISLTPVGTYASKIISDLVYDIKSALRADEYGDSYIKIINESVTNENITIRLNEVVLDNDELIVSLTTISEDEMGKDMKIIRDESAKVYINGELLDSRQDASIHNASKTNDDEVMFLGIDTKKYTGKIDVKMDLGDVSIYKIVDEKLIKQNTVKGSYVFEFDFDTTKINKDIKTVLINKEIDMGENGKITLGKYVYTPLSQKIYYMKNDIAEQKDENLVLKGKDDLGNEVKFNIYSEGNGVGQFKVNTPEEAVNKSAKYLILTLYKRVYTEDSKEIELKEIKKDIKIDLTNIVK